MTDTRVAPRHPDLIYDVGLHRGEDTGYYLAKGFRVVAVEANPELVRECRETFAAEIAAGRLVIVEGAVVDPEALPTSDTVVFWVNQDLSVWGTACEHWAERNERRGSPSRRIEVPAVNLAEVIADHGVPYYMKIDIEGADLACLRALAQFDERPAYVSLESDRDSYAGVVRELDLLTGLGYDAFQAIEQASLPHVQSPPRPAREGADVDYFFEPGSSGLFGADLPDRWKSRDALLRQYRLIRFGTWLFDRDGLTRAWRLPGIDLLRAAGRRSASYIAGVPVASWYDTHARHRSVGARAG